MKQILLFFVNAILALNIIFFKSTIIGAVFLVLYLAANGYLAGNIVKKLLDVKDAIISWLLGIFLIFSLVSFAGGAAIVLYRFDNVILAGIIMIVSLACLLCYRQFISDCSFYKRLKPKFLSAGQVFSKINFQSPLTFVYIAIALLFFIGFYTVFASAMPKEHIISPWQALPAQFAWVIALLSALILGFIFFKPAKYLLILIILFSFLQHFYIPAVYRMPYGLDDWRHIGMMEKIAVDGAIEPLSIIGSLTSPKLSYSSFWAGALFASKSLNVNLVQLTVWWQAIFFSLFLPILMYALACKMGKHFKSSTEDLKCFLPLLAAFLPALFYPFQLYGAISLPVGFNFLFFLFFLITVITWLNGQNHKLKYIIAAEFILMFFGYVIYWLFAGLIIGFLIVRKLTQNYSQSVKQKLARVTYLFLSMLFIPIVSLWTSPNARFDILTTQMDYFGDFWKHNLQYLTGFKKIGSPRPQAGNLIWHDLRQNFADIAPFHWQYFDTVLLVILVVLLILGFRKLSKKAEKSDAASMILYMFTIAIGSIFLDRYYFGGIHLLTERLDLIVNLSLILILVAVVSVWVMKFSSAELARSARSNSPRAKILSPKPLLSVFIIIFLGFAISSTFISGPVYGRATEPHYQADQLIWKDMEEHGRQNYSVLSEHFPLAALEAVSGGQVVNGNFPIQYGYLEKGGKIFIKMFSSPDVKWMQKAAHEAGSAGCYFILDSRFTADWNLAQIRGILGREIFKVDDVRVWVYHET